MSGNKRKHNDGDGISEPKVKKTKVEKIKKFKCDVCDKRFALPQVLRDHHRVHTGEKPFKCTDCDKSFTQRSSLLVHRRFHTGEKPYQCDICEKRFYQNSELKDHKVSHAKDRPFGCEICKKLFKSLRSLNLHKKIHRKNTEEPKQSYSCKYCDKICCNKRVLKYHVKRHTIPYKCDKCSASFASIEAFKKHKLCHEENSTGNFYCKYCYLAFKNYSALKWHYQAHVSVYRLICNFCGFRFVRPNLLKNHIKIQHLRQFKLEHCNLKLDSGMLIGEHPLYPKVIADATELSKNFKCMFCSASFIKQKALDWHNQSHSLENPFKCAKCRWRFKNKADLEAHTALPPGTNNAIAAWEDDPTPRLPCIWNIVPILPVLRKPNRQKMSEKSLHPTEVYPIIVDVVSNKELNQNTVTLDKITSRKLHQELYSRVKSHTDTSKNYTSCNWATTQNDAVVEVASKVDLGQITTTNDTFIPSKIHQNHNITSHTDISKDTPACIPAATLNHEVSGVSSEMNLDQNTRNSTFIPSKIHQNLSMPSLIGASKNPPDLKIGDSNYSRSNIPLRRSNRSTNKSLSYLYHDESSDALDGTDSDSDWFCSDEEPFIRPESTLDSNCQSTNVSKLQNSTEDINVSLSLEEVTIQNQLKCPNEVGTDKLILEKNSENLSSCISLEPEVSPPLNVTLNPDSENDNSKKIFCEIKKETVPVFSEKNTSFPEILLRKIKIEAFDQPSISEMKSTYHDNSAAYNINTPEGLTNNLISVTPRGIVPNGIKVEVCCNTITNNSRAQIHHETNLLRDRFKIGCKESELVSEMLPTLLNNNNTIMGDMAVGLPNKFISFNPRVIVPNGIKVENWSNTSTDNRAQIDHETKFLCDSLKIKNKELELVSEMLPTLNNNSYSIKSDIAMSLPNNLISLAPRAIVPNGIKVEVCCTDDNRSRIHELSYTQATSTDSNGKLIRNESNYTQDIIFSESTFQEGNIQNDLSRNKSTGSYLFSEQKFDINSVAGAQSTSPGLISSIAYMKPQDIHTNCLKVELCCETGDLENVKRELDVDPD